MAGFVFNIAKGAIGYYTMLPGASDSIILIALEVSGMVSDSVMQDYDTVADLLAGATNEQTTVGRKTLSVTRTVDDTNNWVSATFVDDAYAAATGNAIGALITAYVPSSGAADSAILPLTKHDFAATPSGIDIPILVASTGFFRAS